MDQVLNFICWKWTSYKGVISTKKPFEFTSGDVNSLYMMLKKHYHKPFQLTCITDDPEGIDEGIKTLPLWDELRDMGGCFTRLVCFKEGMKDILGERFVSIDLDCVILKDITDLFDRDEDFVIWNSGNLKNPYCGSLWMLRTGTRTEVYDTFDREEWIPNHKGRFPKGTDQYQICKALGDGEATWKKKASGIFNYRKMRKNSIPENTRIVFFNGDFHPRQESIRKQKKWVKKHYPIKKGKKSITPIDIICFYWQGKEGSGWEDTDLAHKYINNLYKGVSENLSIPFRFFCYHKEGLEIENVNPAITLVPFTSPNWRGNIPKMKAFDSNNDLGERAVILDLDLLITGNLDDIFSYDGQFMTRAGFKNENKSGGDIVFFKTKMKFPFWNHVLNEHKLITQCRGSERAIYRGFFHRRLKGKKIDLIQDIYPDQVYSYKRDVGCNGEVPENCRILSCHGHSVRPHQIETDWIKDYWR